MVNNFDNFPKSYDKTSFRIIKTPSSNAKKAFYYVQETGYIKIISAHKTSRKELSSYLFVYVVSGKGTLEYEEKTYQVSAGQCFYIDCMKIHRYFSSSEDPWEIYWVHFNGSSAKDYYELFEKKDCTVFYPADRVKVEAYLSNLTEINKEESYHTEVKSSQIILSLVTQALLVGRQCKRLYSKIAQSARQYIDNNYTDKISLDLLESKLYVSRFHIEKEFKRAYGIAVIEYVISKRMNYAKKLLRFTNKSIEEIAILCGFSDQSYFNRQFKKSEGITGTAFRKKWRN